MTPALLTEEGAKAHAAHQASTVEMQQGALSAGPDQAAMKSALLALSPDQKLRLGGDRIRLAKAKKKAKAKGKGKAGPGPGQYTGQSRCIACEFIRRP
jgi:hypothetical protein